MRITRDKLIELARREAEQRTETSDVISGYLIGSVVKGQPLLGDTADIDLVLIHDGQPALSRESVPLSDQVHFDIAHHSRDLYDRPRELRVHPWLGPAMCEPIFLHDPQHFFEWAQAGARGQFYRPDHMHSRALAFLKRAREARSVLALSGRWIKTYTRAALEAANAVACLSGFPVAGRRLALSLELVIKELGYPEVYVGLMRLLGAETLQGWDMPEWLSAWARAFDAASVLVTEPDLAPCRRSYYLSGFQALVEADRPETVIWTLLTTWERSMYALNTTEMTTVHSPTWETLLQHLRLGPSSAASRSEELENYLDQVEDVVETWARQMGA